MNILRKAVTAFGSVVLAALLVAALAPKATHGLVATFVQVANTNGTPVPTGDAFGTANLIPYHTSAAAATNSAGFLNTTVYTAPSGERAVIESVETQCQGPNGAVVFLNALQVTPPLPGTSQFHFLPAQQQLTASGQTWYVSNISTRIYVDPGYSIEWQLFSSDTAELTTCQVILNGRLAPTT